LSESEKVTDKILKSLIRLFSKPMPFAKVGIIGKASARSDTKKTNAQIGAIHEFGSPQNNIPQRSFLRVPLEENVQKAIDNFKKQKILNITELVDKLGAAGQSIVQEAFTNGGYGKWEPTKKYIKRVLVEGKDKKTAGDILVDTGQLRDSISYEVVEK